MLNGRLLELVDDTALPDFSPKPASPPFVLPPLRYGFFVVKKANVRACLWRKN